MYSTTTPKTGRFIATTKNRSNEKNLRNLFGSSPSHVIISHRASGWWIAFFAILIFGRSRSNSLNHVLVCIWYASRSIYVFYHSFVCLQFQFHAFASTRSGSGTTMQRPFESFINCVFRVRRTKWSEFGWANGTCSAFSFYLSICRVSTFCLVSVPFFAFFLPRPSQIGCTCIRVRTTIYYLLIFLNSERVVAEPKIRPITGIECNICAS